jgi:uncharacterized membrane protein
MQDDSDGLSDSLRTGSKSEIEVRAEAFEQVAMLAEDNQQSSAHRKSKLSSGFSWPAAV